MSSESPPATQFTEDAIAHQETICERSSCAKIIKPGQLRRFIANVNQANAGKHVCADCYQYYLQGPSTTMRSKKARNTSEAGRFASVAHTTPLPQRPSVPPFHASKAMPAGIDMKSIRAHTNESQRQGVHHPQSRVMAMAVPPSRQMGPAIEDPSYYQRVFGSFGHPSPIPGPSSMRPSIGYSVAHEQYAQETKRWSQIAYPSKNLNKAIGNVPIMALGAYFSPNKNGYERILPLKEGSRVTSDFLPIDIINQVKKALSPGLMEKYQKGEFVFDFEKMVVCELSVYVDLSSSGVPPHLPYFTGRFIKKGKKDDIEVFDPPKKPIEFLLIIDSDHWEASERALDNFYLQQAYSMKAKPSGPQPSAATAFVSDFDAEQWGSMEKFDQIIPKSNAGAAEARLGKKRKATSELIVISDNDDSPKIKACNITKTTDEALQLDENIIREGIRRGGRGIQAQTLPINNVLSERIQFHPILVAPFKKLLIGTGEPYLDLRNTFHGLIACDPRKESPSFLDQGAFKTASKAKLTLMNTVPSPGLGTQPNITEDVALKRFFQPTSGQKITRYPAADEKNKILNEAKLMGWAASLLRLSYSFINRFQETAGPAPFPIPLLRFVHAGVAFAQKDVNKAGYSHSTLRASYLLEELIQGDEQPFQKYIHNSDAVPLQDSNEDGYQTAVFLCFLQHIQYQETAHQAYISDFQGGRTLLTDPQIMTNPDLGDDLFGEGNCDEAFHAFPDQHECNKYCKWFKLTTLTLNNA